MTKHRVYTELEELISLRIKARQLTLKFDSRRLQQINGIHLSRFRGQGIDFAEHRQYQAGDDPRSIDWRVTARRGRTHTRVYHEEIERPVLIMSDQSVSMFFGSQFAFKSVRSAELAALISWTGLQHNDRIGGLVFSDQGYQAIKPSRHAAQALRFLECVNTFNNTLKLPVKDPSFSLNMALVELRRIARPGSQCFLISDWRQFDADSARLIFELGRHCQILVFQVFDPLEAHLPPGRFGISNGERELQVDTGNSQLEKRFETAYDHWQKTIVTSLAKTGVGCAPVSTWQDPFTRLQELQIGATTAVTATGIVSKIETKAEQEIFASSNAESISSQFHPQTSQQSHPQKGKPGGFFSRRSGI